MPAHDPPPPRSLLPLHAELLVGALRRKKACDLYERARRQRTCGPVDSPAAAERWPQSDGAAMPLLADQDKKSAPDLMICSTAEFEPGNFCRRLFSWTLSCTPTAATRSALSAFSDSTATLRGKGHSAGYAHTELSQTKPLRKEGEGERGILQDTAQESTVRTWRISLGSQQSQG